MVRRRRFSLAAVAAMFLAAIAVGVSAQAERKAATLDDLLAEMRGLRADLAQTTHATMRMQLLTARLSLQEQRIAVLTNQRAALLERLASAARERIQLETRVKGIQSGMPGASVQQREESEFVLKIETARLTQQLEAERQLRLQEMELTGLIESEQGRWQDFNRRLDELERSISAGTPR